MKGVYTCHWRFWKQKKRFARLLMVLPIWSAMCQRRWFISPKMFMSWSIWAISSRWIFMDGTQWKSSSAPLSATSRPHTIKRAAGYCSRRRYGHCRAALVMEENGHDVVSDNYIRYTDKLVKQEGKWLIKEREQHFVITKKQDL